MTDVNLFKVKHPKNKIVEDDGNGALTKGTHLNSFGDCCCFCSGCFQFLAQGLGRCLCPDCANVYCEDGRYRPKHVKVQP